MRQHEGKRGIGRVRRFCCPKPPHTLPFPPPPFHVLPSSPPAPSLAQHPARTGFEPARARAQMVRSHSPNMREGGEGGGAGGGLEGMVKKGTPSAAPHQGRGREGGGRLRWHVRDSPSSARSTCPLFLSKKRKLRERERAHTSLLPRVFPHPPTRSRARSMQGRKRERERERRKDEREARRVRFFRGERRGSK